MVSGGRWYERCGSSLVGPAVCLLLLAACAPRQSMFVLIPDPEGAVGQITVTNRAGTQVLDRPRQASAVRSADVAPRPPSTLEETEIRRIFKEALAVQPVGPARFILYFKHDSDDLTPESEALISEVFRTVRDRGATVISIIGHTDTVGARDYNYELSLGRAKKVASLLASQGMGKNVLEIESHGKDNLLVKTGDQVPEPRNRRVEITVW